MPSCQSFKQKIAEFKKKTEELRFALEQYKNGEGKYLEIFKEDYGKLEEEIEEFRENEYAERAEEMIKEWNPLLDSMSNNFVDELKFNQTGRVIFLGSLSLKKPFIKIEEVSFFPNLIKEIKSFFNIQSTGLINIDNLEIVSDTLDCYKTERLHSFKMLKKIGKSLRIMESAVKHFDSLEEIGEDLDIAISNIRTIQDFLTMFPKLKKIGEDIRGVSIYVSFELLNYFKSEFEKLRDEGRLDFRGKIAVSD